MQRNQVKDSRLVGICILSLYPDLLAPSPEMQGLFPGSVPEGWAQGNLHSYLPKISAHLHCIDTASITLYPALIDSHVDKVSSGASPRHALAGGRCGPPVGRSAGGIAAQWSPRRPGESSGAATRPLARPWHGTLSASLRLLASHHQDGLARIARDREAVPTGRRPI